VTDNNFGNQQKEYAYVSPDPEFYNIKYNGMKYKIKVKQTSEGVELWSEDLDLKSFAPNTTVKAIKGKIEIR